jgi:hypothetical protein
MTAKLTLSIDADTITAAKRFAADNGTSVSRLVEAFLETVASSATGTPETPVLKRLRGSLAGVSPADHHEHLAAKYR